MKQRNMGRFFLSSRHLLEWDGQLRQVFADVIVLEAQHRYDREGTEYLARGDCFDEVPEGEIAPEYEVKFDMDGGHTWERLVPEREFVQHRRHFVGTAGD